MLTLSDCTFGDWTSDSPRHKPRGGADLHLVRHVYFFSFTETLIRGKRSGLQ
jgi:hypothetical protein